MPDAAQAQGHLLDQVVNGVPLHVRPLVGVEVDALLGNGQDTQAGAPQPRDGHQVVGPDGVAWSLGPRRESHLGNFADALIQSHLQPFIQEQDTRRKESARMRTVNDEMADCGEKQQNENESKGK